MELVRTSKVKIYAQPTDQSQTAKQEVEKVRKAAHQKQVAQLEEKKMARTQARWRLKNSHAVRRLKRKQPKRPKNHVGNVC